MYFIPIEDVETWPVFDPVDAVIKNPITIKAGATIYACEATEKEKTFSEVLVDDNDGGPYMDMQVVSHLAGNTITNTLGLAAMINRQFALIIFDRDGTKRLIGTQDAGAVLYFDYTSGDLSSSRYRKLVWKFKHPLPAPVYLGGTVIMDDQNEVFTALTLVDRFRVGVAGAPMDDGDTDYTNPLLANAQFIMLADGKAIHQMTDDPFQRYATKTSGSDTIHVNGGVTFYEVIEIYKF